MIDHGPEIRPKVGCGVVGWNLKEYHRFKECNVRGLCHDLTFYQIHIIGEGGGNAGIDMGKILTYRVGES